MSEVLGIDEFLARPGPVLDVRSPAEYAHGHIPGAASFPVFSDNERSEVGRRYKQVGRDQAVELGFELAGPKCAELVRRGKALAVDGCVRVHCWRGGMRSQSMAWMLELAGLRVVILDGGYKQYRRWVRRALALTRPLVVVEGMTGTAKTSLLHTLAEMGEAVIDLEGLANHRGSSFGGLLMPEQPSTAHFENLLADRWAQFDGRSRVWIEAESRRVGSCHVPSELYLQMEEAPAVHVVRATDERLDALVEEYGKASTDELVAATERLSERMGGDHVQSAVALIRDGDLRAACAMLLDYYDRAYAHDKKRRPRAVAEVDVSGLGARSGARALQECVEDLQAQCGVQ